MRGTIFLTWPCRYSRAVLLLLLLAAAGCPDNKLVTPVHTGSSQPSGGSAAAADLRFGVLSPNLKVRPADQPKTATGASLKAARNELEAFQIVFTAPGPVTGVAVRLAKRLTGPNGATLPDGSVVLYRVAYYRVAAPSNTEGASRRWPDPLIPAVDTYVGQKRKAFPFDVPKGESRVVWVDILVPKAARPGHYEGRLDVLVQEKPVGSVPISLMVGEFTLPSTATLRSAFDLDYAQPCMAHTKTDTCAKEWNERAAYTLRERYVRAGLEHRFSIFNVFFQPPFGSKDFEDLMLPLVNGKGKTRLSGARLTSVRIDATEEIDKWVGHAKSHGYFDRLLHYPVDEPGDDPQDWALFKKESARLHGIAPGGKILITSSIRDADRAGATDLVDIFVPLINHIEDRPHSGSDYAGSQRTSYDKWLQAVGSRQLWGYQSCMSHGCGECGEASPDRGDTGWPNRVIDSGAVQNRAFPWLAFIHDLSGELYFEVAEQLSTAWDDNGQCKFSGSGDGTLFYPGKASLIGGTVDIPIESIRMKMIREGMEDYEYLILVARKDRPRAEAIARALFPHAYQCNQPPHKLAAARDKLFTLLNSK